MLAEAVMSQRSANIGLWTDVACNASNIRERAAIGVSIGGREFFTSGAVIGDEQTYSIFTELSGNPCAGIRLRDAPGEEKLDRCLEVTRILDEEQALLREEDFEPLVHQN